MSTLTDLRQTALALVAALAMSATCLVAAAGPVRAGTPAAQVR